MTYFNFSATGNFSTDFGWDNGFDNFELGNSFTPNKDDQTAYGVYVNSNNSHGGSRTQFGYVVAHDRDQATQLLHDHYEAVNQDYV